MSVCEIGDAQPIVKVCLNRDGWEWFLGLCRANLSPRDLFLREVEAVELYLREDDE